jgi:hypothetical protein
MSKRGLELSFDTVHGINAVKEAIRARPAERSRGDTQRLFGAMRWGYFAFL